MEKVKKYLISVNEDMEIVSAPRDFYFGLGIDDLQNLNSIIPPQDIVQLKKTINELEPGERNITCFRMSMANGKPSWIAANVEKSGFDSELINMELSDMKGLKNANAAMFYDDMTGIFNKRFIQKHAQAVTEEEPKRSFYLCLLDIDHFKTVNDTFGHLCGDEVIIDIAHIIRDCVGADGMVGRIGGDEFLLVLDGVSEKMHLRQVLADVRKTVETKYKQFKGRMNITVSIGTALYPDYANCYDDLFKLTDKMLYLAKVKGRNRYIIYTPEMHGSVEEVMSAEVVTNLVARTTTRKEKISLMLRFLRDFLHNTETSIYSAIKEILAVYDFDAIYVYTGGLDRCTYGIERVSNEDGTFVIKDSMREMNILASSQFQQIFDENSFAGISIFNTSTKNSKDVFEYMINNKQHYMMAYHMSSEVDKGYFVCISRRDNSRRLSDADVSDLVYFGRMLELTNEDR